MHNRYIAMYREKNSLVETVQISFQYSFELRNRVQYSNREKGGTGHVPASDSSSAADYTLSWIPPH